ncbi:MAG: phage replisome organizer N-terminal domain-containing protein [Acholeplasma sp.]|nr:phage replisome organizer N-terminal domain-containing protein [Acholeplasma sp.]
MRHDKRNEVYYWIKLRQDLMQSKEMKLLMRQPDGGWYFSIYVYLIMLSINSEGKLIQRVNDMEMIYDLTTITQELMFFKIDTIRVAIDMLKKLGLLYEDETRVICITGFDKLVGSETGWAEVKRKQKEKQMVGNGVEKVHAILHTNFPPEIRDKSIEYRDENIDIKSIDHNDRNDKYDKYDKVTFSSDSVIINQLRNLKINQWHEEFLKAHVLTKYLVYSKYLEEGDMDNLIASNAFFENYLNSTYGFDELKKHVQYFLFQFRKLSKSDKGKIENKLGYLTNAIKKNQRSVEWSNSSELKDILKLSESIQVKLNKEAKSLFPSDEIKQQLYCKENYLTYHNSEMKRLRQSFDKKCSVR